MKFKLNQVVGRNPFLQNRVLSIQALLHTLRGERIDDMSETAEVSFEEAAVIWEYAAVLSRQIIQPDAMMVFVQRYAGHLVAHARTWEKTLEAEVDDPWLPQILIVSDRRFIQLATVPEIYDLSRCTIVSELPATFEGVSYNLAIPVKQECDRIKREAENVAKSQAKAGTAGPTNPGDSVVSRGGGRVKPGGFDVGPGDNPSGAGGGPSLKDIERYFEQANGGA